MKQARNSESKIHVTKQDLTSEHINARNLFKLHFWESRQKGKFK